MTYSRAQFRQHGVQSVSSCRVDAVSVFRGQAVEGAAVCRWSVWLCKIDADLSVRSLHSGFIQLLHQKPPDSQTPTQQCGQHQSKNQARMCC